MRLIEPTHLRWDTASTMFQAMPTSSTISRRRGLLESTTLIRFDQARGGQPAGVNAATGQSRNCFQLFSIVTAISSEIAYTQISATRKRVFPTMHFHLLGWEFLASSLPVGLLMPSTNNVSSVEPHGARSALDYREVRAATVALAMPLSDADATVQSMPDASPAKWHLAHTTLFFESMVLTNAASNYKVFDERFNFLFNSYYDSVGARHPRPLRGLLTRPALAEVLAYREYVDAAIAQLLQRMPTESVLKVIELGCHHEQQHQELLLTDILHLFAQNPLQPAYRESVPLPVEPSDRSQTYRSFPGGRIELGHQGEGFAFDCEGPRHKAHIEPYRLSDRLVTNREWAEFIADDGNRNHLLWLSGGWAMVRSEGWSAPLYWQGREGEYWSMTLRGAQPVDPDAPVTHVSYFEADAFATWAVRRLPTEFGGGHAGLG